MAGSLLVMPDRGGGVQRARCRIVTNVGSQQRKVVAGTCAYE